MRQRQLRYPTVFVERTASEQILASPFGGYVLVIQKGGETWSLIYTDATVREAAATLARWAANPELSFSWYDAAVLGQAIRQRRAA